ncbi:MAG: bifunctional [glutamine synthetase] adenylyltransferase/[glutamine synthetase]-adenylyl-L-tyrosine phosphorylase [Rickettsiales bacterium]|nr:bifunctional [glutamine synthetase] adenylyltransferase/[glutamine synthetase]-adenylyl-L-tyrosine phosphorylase [Rickettsiales bacterium]
MVHPDSASINTDFLPKPYQLTPVPEVFSSFSGTPFMQLLETIYGTSPHLSKLLDKHPDIARAFYTLGADTAFTQLDTDFSDKSEAGCMRDMRIYKQHAGLLIAMADIAGIWTLDQVTEALSKLAKITLQASLDYLIKHYQKQYGLQIRDAEDGCGIIILAMGKLGAQELNYSSDVDLILLYEADKLSLKTEKPTATLLNRIAQDMIRLMQERTADGYVFRMDLRLRPDPASTPLMLNTETAFRYYESVGQNWERAAFIKAHPVAGDIAAGERFLNELKPFIWRKSLDFAAIADIQSIKRQMDRAFDNLEIEIAGYDVKKGLGGIREIEFLAQIHQLIWGGRRQQLRSRRTLETYQALQVAQLVTAEEVATLSAHYETLRMIEHRLQMLHDAQTHQIPLQEDERTRVALFCGYSSLDEFEAALTNIAIETHTIYHQCFNEDESLAGDGKLSFIGVSHDSETLKTLRKMGFKDPATICDTIQSWHRGSIAAMRSSRSRELLTELTPTLLSHISEQVDADATFKRFAKFFSKLPGGVTLLSLLYNNAQLLAVFMNIIGNAPQLADYLSKHPDWLDALLTLGRNKALAQASLNPTKHYRLMSHQPEEAASWLCRYRAEHEFVMGCQVLAGNLDPLKAMPVLTHIADTAVTELSQNVIHIFEEQYGKIADSSFHIVALGRLGTETLTFGSDLDLLFLYDAPDELAESDGERSLGVSAYYNRLAQRITGQLNAMTPEGRLYEVDGRLRPAGSDGPLAVSLKALQQYYAKDAWIFERMALLKQRLIISHPDQGDKVQKALTEILQQPLDATQVRQDALNMRKRLWAEFGTDNPWSMKQAKGGLMDITFIHQVCALQNKLLSKAEWQTLEASLNFQQHAQSILRLCHDQFEESKFSSGLKQILARSLGLKTFDHVRQDLRKHQQASYTIFSKIIGDYT